MRAVCAGLALLVGACSSDGADVADALGDAGEAGHSGNGSGGADGGTSAGGAAGSSGRGELAPGCACSGELGVSTSLECYCQANLCPSYDEIMEGDASCGNATRHEGCGKITFRDGVWYSSRTYVYDAITLELIGARISNDVPFGPCAAGTYRAGDSGDCTEGMLCDHCDAGAPDSCAEACSADALAVLGSPLGYEDVIQLRSCGAGTSKPELRVGCGSITRLSDSAPGWLYHFDAETHSLLGRMPPFQLLAPPCDSFGVAPPECPDATPCSLCIGDANACEL